MQKSVIFVEFTHGTTIYEISAIFSVYGDVNVILDKIIIILLDC